MKNLFTGLLVVTCLVFAISKANAANIALNADVALNGSSFFTNGWGGGLTVPAQTVTDGVFLPTDQQWDQGAVWWDTHPVADKLSQYIQINLKGVYNINSLVLQADNNDMYAIYYKNLADNSWNLAWNASTYGDWGINTRPEYTLTAPIKTNSFKIVGNNGDEYYSVSEFQANGTPTPEPSSMILGFMGLVGFGLKSFGLKIRNKTIA